MVFGGWSCKALLSVIALVSLSAEHVAAEYGYLSHEAGDGFKCAGLYGTKKEVKGMRSMVEIEFPPEPPSKITVAIFNYADVERIGVSAKTKDSPKDGDDVDDNGAKLFTVCNDESINLGLCSEVDRGRALIDYNDENGKSRKFKSAVFTDYVMLNRSGPGYTALERKAWLDRNGGKDNGDSSWHAKPRTTVVDGATLEWLGDGTLKLRYYANNTGYYCVDSKSTSDFTARGTWSDVHGLLPAAEYPKMIVYLLMMISYIGIALAWAYMSWRVWGEILPVQNQLFGLICLLVVDMGMNFGFWKRYNNSGSPGLLMSLATVIIDAGRNSLSFFMLLVVSLGWGVVRPSLGKAMVRCILLAMLHFSAGCLYGAGIVFRDPHDETPLGLIYVLPLSLTMTIFYVWVLSSIISTTHLLIDRQQSYKLSMYNRLWTLLMISLVLLMVFFVLNILHTVFYTRASFAARTWKWRWFWTDGWLNIEYFIVLCIILFWWRPTAQNYRYSLEELAGDEEEAARRDDETHGRDEYDNPRMGENLEMGVIGNNSKASISGDDVQFVVDDGEYDSDDDEHGEGSAPGSSSVTGANNLPKKSLTPPASDRDAAPSFADRNSRAETLFEFPPEREDSDNDEFQGATTNASPSGDTSNDTARGNRSSK